MADQEVEEIHYNDIGTSLTVEVLDEGAILDISTATELLIFLKKPSGAVVPKTAVLKSGGADGLMHYVTVDGDLDQLEGWEIQGRVTMSTGKWSTEIGCFIVYPNLDS